MMPFLLIGCSVLPENSSSSVNKASGTSVNSSGQTSKDSSASKTSTSSTGHTHVWATTWSYDSRNHWHACRGSGCEEVKDLASHTFGDWENVTSVSSLPTELKYAYANITRKRKCTVCDYMEVDGTNILPEIRFNFDPTDEHADFATVATKSDISRPEVKGTITVTNCDEQYQMTDVVAGMKVRGNQTAGWAKKGFRIKFDKKQNVLGLNGGQKYKKWILLADAKDTCLIRSALGLSLSNTITKDDDKVWAADYTPVTVYLNNQYWGYYYLAEQKEVKEGRINLPEPEEYYDGVDIGYCFELDHYARSEPGENQKGVDGDPSFEVTYRPQMVRGTITGNLAAGGITTYTLLSDIPDKSTTVYTTEKNSVQVAWIDKRVEALYEILYYASKNNVAKDINDNNEVVSTTLSVRETIEKNFDLNAWAEGIIINAYSCPPDLGYSSFYMSFDNSPTGDKKLRFDCPWDFDSNFGNRKNFIVNADELYMNSTHNMWIQLIYGLNFFVNDYVKPKWNALREAEVFEDMFHMMNQYFTDYDAEIKRNHYKWPQNDAAHMPPNNFDEIRSPFEDPAKYKDAEAETIRWCSRRVNYLESVWGTGRPDVNTNK